MYPLKVWWSEHFDVGRALALGYDDDDVLYMVLWGNPSRTDEHVLVYLGQSYRQHMRKRLLQHHKLWQIVGSAPDGMLTYIAYGQLRLPVGKRVSQKLVNDVEAALILANQPPANEASMSNYWGRALRITNIGKYASLRQRLTI